ncbi:MAG: alpha/beta hydrolase, partial [Delftia sp.]|nr:alpha/beta hydrolase [Delftia sp.]
MHTDPWMPGLRQQRITVDDGVEINAWVGGQGPALLLVHGHPQTSAIWHRVAPRLAQQFTVVLADLRGYGDSSRPAGDPEHVNYSKRTMARDLLRLMARL